MLTSPSSDSPFHRVFDVAVFGAGYIGFSAAHALASSGRTVLLVEPSADLLWESSRALENGIASGDREHAEWNQWLQELEQRQGVAGDRFDVALAEVFAASALEQASPALSVLLYATPTAALAQAGSGLTSVTLATKGGLHGVFARQWIDATEQGLLARLCHAQAPSPLRLPDARFRRLVLQSPDWTALDKALDAFLAEHPHFELLPSVRTTERCLRWPVSSEQEWSCELLSVAAELRAKLSPGAFIVSHASQRDFPVYQTHPAPSLPALPSNLLVLAPALIADPLVNISDRFVLGASAPKRIAEMSSAKPSLNATAAPIVSEEWECDVLVTGSGSAGVLAALAARRHGARTIALDIALHPGGQGSEGAITGFCKGMPGGLQEDLHALTEKFSAMLSGRAGDGWRWHYLGRRLAVQESFRAAGIQYRGETLLHAVERDEAGRVTAVLAATQGHVVRIKAKSFVDSTGDGDLCVLAGADFVQGRLGDARCLAFSQSALAVDNREGELHVVPRNYDAGWVDPTDPEDLSRARIKGLAQYLRATWTEEKRPFALAPLLGLRQSRQIQTDVLITLDDLIMERVPQDNVGETLMFLDTHSVDMEFESDEVLFYYWGCQAFRHLLHSYLPYGMLLPRGLVNVWIACRAAGMAPSAAYGVRMQRDLQRLGEAAGTAAAFAATGDGASRNINIATLQARLKQSGAYQPAERVTGDALSPDPLADLKADKQGIYLWQLYRDPEHYRSEVEALLDHENANVSFRAAMLLAMWSAPAAEPRLIAAIDRKEQGPPSTTANRGAFGEEIDIPFWLLSVVLLRRCGTPQCLEPLSRLAADATLPFNVRTSIALTLERLATRANSQPILEIINRLIRLPMPETYLPPSRSVRRTLDGRPQLVLGNNPGADTRDDHSWQLHLIVARTRATLGQEIQAEAQRFLSDRRAFVRNAFQKSLKHFPAKSS